jgi:hypothetical protein
MASHWRMTVDASKFNTPSQRGSHSQPHQACLSTTQIISMEKAWSGYQLPSRSWLCTVTLQFFSGPSLGCSGTSCQYVLTSRETPSSLSVLSNFDCHSEPPSSRACHQPTQKTNFLSHIASLLASLAVMYLDFVVFCAMDPCFLFDQEIIADPKLKQYPEVLF